MGLYREIDRLREKAENGDADAQYQFGCCCYWGERCEADFEESFRWYKLSAKQGHVKAQAALGKSYTWGVGVPKNFKWGVYWFKKAEEQLEDTCARHFLFLAYLNGRGCKQDTEEAIRLLKKDAKLGCYVSMSMLSDLYRKGENGVQWELKKAYAWAILAARYCDNENKEHYRQERDGCERRIFPWDAEDGRKMADEIGSSMVAQKKA